MNFVEFVLRDLGGLGGERGFWRSRSRNPVPSSLRRWWLSPHEKSRTAGACDRQRHRDPQHLSISRDERVPDRRLAPWIRGLCGTQVAALRVDLGARGTGQVRIAELLIE
jgi:hypothetical protein